MERIKYTCANCGWETSVIAIWKDVKPIRCMNKKCNTSFRKNPEALITKDPTLIAKESKKSSPSPAKTTSSSSSAKKKEQDSEKESSSNKQKASVETEQQQEDE